MGPVAAPAEAVRGRPQGSLVALVADLRKAFDHVNRGLVFHIWRRIGVPGQIIALLQGWHDGMERRWRLANGALSHGWQATRGVLQGCSWSVLALLALGRTWDLWIRESGPRGEVTGAAYAGSRQSQEGDRGIDADDYFVLGLSLTRFLGDYAAAQGWSQAVGMHVDAAKTRVMCVGDTLRGQVEEVFDVKGGDLYGVGLGVLGLPVGPEEGKAYYDAKIAEVRVRLGRLQYLDLPWR